MRLTEETHINEAYFQIQPPLLLRGKTERVSNMSGPQSGDKMIGGGDVKTKESATLSHVPLYTHGL